MSTSGIRFWLKALGGCLLIFPLLVSYGNVSHADSAANTLSEIKESIKSKMQKVEETIKKEKSVRSSIDKINESVNQTERELKVYEKSIKQTEINIQHLESEIDSLSSQLSGRQRSMEEYIRALYMRQNNNNALILISADDYQDLIKKSKFISFVAYHNSQAISSYKEDLNDILSRKNKLDALREEIAVNKRNIQNKKKKLKSDREKKSELLAVIKSRRKAHEKKIKELETSSKRLLSMVKGLTPSKIPKSLIGKGFNSSKGELPWPVSGKVVNSYGSHVDPELKVRTFNNGIEIKVEKNEVPKSIAGGRVVFASSFENMGLMVIIDHGNGYHSVYGNLSDIALKKGDLLISGFDIGKVGVSKDLKIPALYFEIRHKGKPVDPMEWLGNKGQG